MVVALNMIDLAERRRLSIDPDALARRLGCPVVPISASRKTGLHALCAQIADMAAEPRAAAASLSYGSEIEDAIAEIQPLIADHAHRRNWSPRWLAVSLLETADTDAVPVEGVAEAIERLATDIERKTGEDADIIIADGRYGFAHALVGEVMKHRDRISRTLSDHIDRLVLNRVLGIPIFLAVIYAMFLFTINLGGAFVDFFDIAVGTIAVDGTRALLTMLDSPAWMIAVLADGVGAGIQTVSTFIPILATLFLFLSVLEDSGYMARGAYVMDRVMRAIGLPGKSFVPLVIGFGCTVPAVMATRTLDSRRDRLLTAIMSPFMSCGARLPVYALFAAAFFPVGGQNVVFALYLIGIIAAITTGFVLRRTLLAGDTAPFLMELPPYRLPSLRPVLLRTRDRLNAFLVKAGRFILPAVAVLGLLNSIGTDGSLGNQDSERSVLASIGRSITPVFTPMGITEDNWPATVGLFTGRLRQGVDGRHAGCPLHPHRPGRTQPRPVGGFRSPARPCRGGADHPGKSRRTDRCHRRSVGAGRGAHRRGRRDHRSLGRTGRSLGNLRGHGDPFRRPGRRVCLSVVRVAVCTLCVGVGGAVPRNWRWMDGIHRHVVDRDGLYRGGRVLSARDLLAPSPAFRAVGGITGRRRDHRHRGHAQARHAPAGRIHPLSDALFGAGLFHCEG